MPCSRRSPPCSSGVATVRPTLVTVERNRSTSSTTSATATEPAATPSHTSGCFENTQIAHPRWFLVVSCPAHDGRHVSRAPPYVGLHGARHQIVRGSARRSGESSPQ